jgi:hypothetical protein
VEHKLNITKISVEGNVKYDPFLVETLVKSDKSSNLKNEGKSDRVDWSSEILKDGLSKLENSIQSSEDTSPLSYKSAPAVMTMQDAQKVLSEIDTDDLKKMSIIFSQI